MPSGNNAKPAILKLAMPNGIPMFVMHNSTPAKTRAMAIQIPAKMNHSTLPIIEPAPVSGSGTTVRPFGHNAKLANLNDEIPNGIVTIKKNRKDSSSASRNDPLSSTTQVTLPHIRGARCMAYRARRTSEIGRVGAPLPARLTGRTWLPACRCRRPLSARRHQSTLGLLRARLGSDSTRVGRRPNHGDLAAR